MAAALGGMPRLGSRTLTIGTYTDGHPPAARCIAAAQALVMGGALLLAGCTAAAARPAAPRVETARLEETVLDLVNRHRRAHGLAALVPDPRIARQARAHSAAMAAGKTPLGHAGFDARAAALHELMKFRGIGENVAVNSGHRDPAAEAVRGWLASRGHRANIEGPYERTGIGVASNAKNEVYFTQIFVGP
jgi:uncharacterized protein YkwD